MTDAYAATASAYEFFALPFRDAQYAALDRLVPSLRPDAGPILDIGAGSGAFTAWALERFPAARVVALEPSPAMRALLLARIAASPAWYPRVTVRPEGFFDATLPERLGGAIALGVLGHFDPGERRAVLAELAARLPRGGAALIDLQEPQRPRRIAPYEFTVATVGDLTYRGIAEAWPMGIEEMRWRMTYLSLEGERVLTEETTEHLYHHPAPDLFAREAEDAGLTARRLEEGPFWLLERR
ncbi:MAG TPA: class I SAM-dependent methyltransferase [Arachnia sp.]|nr:class I SAM-dependent methyltransferase [Arachnia sp.]HMT85564.1 class I SAM-dependent methyltransferase [Arachnia sp.]